VKKKQVAEDVNVHEVDYVRQYRIGTRLVIAIGERYKYAKIDFGILGKLDNKPMRHIEYRWIRTW
jgi:hypothetical protein